MFCGFGAVVLLVLILNTDTVKARNDTMSDLRAEVQRLEEEARNGREGLVQVRNALQQADKAQVVVEGESEQVIRRVKQLTIEEADLAEQTLARKEHLNALSSDVENLDEEARRLGAEVEAQGERGRKVHRFVGEGDRQYLTGLKLGGKRVLILLDASASMLDETVVNAILRRHQSEAQRRAAPKWKRAVAATEWLIANLPPRSRFQVHGFDVKSRALIPALSGQWLKASKAEDVGGVIKALRQLAPEKGTSLFHAFSAARKLDPRPDNILLITDGLPTQGRYPPSSATVSGKQRLAHFEAAMDRLPRGVPVNTILLPMEGDAMAAAAYWKLALATGGSFLTPARDWP